MATDPTTIPSVVDLQKTKKSMTDIDTFVDSGDDSFTDNNGQVRRTLTGINSEITQTLLEINKSRGYRVVGTFATGFDYELFNDVGIDASGNSWIYVGAGAPAKTVTAGTVPSAPDYQQVTYNSIDGVVGLRDELNGRLKVYKNTGLKSAVENMINGDPVAILPGESACTGGTIWKLKDSIVGAPSSISDFIPTTPIYTDDFRNDSLTGNQIVQAAINANVFGGEVVLTPNAVYSFQAPVTMYAGTLTGTGRDHQVPEFLHHHQIYVDFNGPAFRIAAARTKGQNFDNLMVKFDNIKFRSDKATYPQASAIETRQSVTGDVIERCFFNNVACGINVLTSYGIAIRDNHFNDVGTCIAANSLTFPIENPPQIGGLDYWETNAVRIYGNKLTSGNGIGIDINCIGYGWVINGENVIEANSVAGVLIRSQTGVNNAVSGRMQNIDLSDNYFEINTNDVVIGELNVADSVVQSIVLKNNNFNMSNYNHIPVTVHAVSASEIGKNYKRNSDNVDDTIYNFTNPTLVSTTDIDISVGKYAGSVSYNQGNSIKFGSTTGRSLLSKVVVNPIDSNSITGQFITDWDGGDGKPFKTLQDAFNWLRFFYTDMAFEENGLDKFQIELSNNGGALPSFGSPHQIQLIEIKGVSNAVVAGGAVTNGSTIQMSDLTIATDGSTSFTPFSVNRGATLIMSSCDFNHTNTVSGARALHAFNASTVMLQNCTSTDGLGIIGDNSIIYNDSPTLPSVTAANAGRVFT